MPFSSIGQKNCELRSVMTWGIYSSLSLQRSNWKWRKISLFMAINQIHLPCYFFCATTPNHIMRAKTSLIHCWSSSDQGLVYYHFYLSLVCCYCTIKCKQSSLSLMMANRHLISKTFFFLARLETHSIKHVYVNHCLAFSRNVGTKKKANLKLVRWSLWNKASDFDDFDRFSC